MIHHVNDDTFAHAVLEADKPVLVDFTAKWCGPCKAQKPVLVAFADKHPEIRVVELDVEDSPRAAAAHGVMAMPSLLLFRAGQVVARARGLQSAAKLEALLVD
jgi:thioredoxin 1